MKIPNYTPITLITNKYINDGVKAGDYGVIIEIYEDGYEVEFMDESGNTLNCFGVRTDEVEVCKNQNEHTKL
jgi:Domain of unknown function (DUF4926)